MKSILLIFLSYFLITPVFATHFPGGEISYACTATPGIFEVTLIIYRNCSGGSVALCSSGCGGACDQAISVKGADQGYIGSGFGTFLLQLKSVRDVDVKPTCPAIKSVCNNMGCVTAGTYTPAVERYEFKGLVNLGPTSGIPAACCNVSLSFQACCRSHDILTGGADASYYNEAIINRCYSVSPCNSSPVFKNDHNVQICGSENYRGNWGAVDPDRDSLSYSFAPALTEAGVSVPYITPYAYDRPLPWVGNVNGIFPGGIHCNPLNGDIMFTPTQANPSVPFKGIVCIEVKQWKKVNGTPIVIGKTRRDVEMSISGSCIPNNPPRLMTNPPDFENPFIPNMNQYICEGEQLCFTVTAKDTDVALPTISDTTYLRWDSALAHLGATFLPDYDITKRNKPDSLGGGPREDRYKFCWTPPAGSASTIPYYFTVTAADKRCPNPGRLTSAFSITVLPKASAQIHLSAGDCNQYLLNYSNTTPAVPILSANWHIARTANDSTFVNGFDSYPASTTPAPFALQQQGRIYIRLEVISGGPIGSTGCSKTFSRYIDVNPINVSDSTLVTDILCAGKTFGKIDVYAYNGAAPYQYKLNNQASYTSTNSYTNLIAGKHIIYIKDMNNCIITDTVEVMAPASMGNAIAKQNPVCHNGSTGSIMMHASGGVSPYTYSINEQPAQSDSSFNNLTPGKYHIVIKDANACLKNDSVVLENPAELNIHYTFKQALCVNGTDGNIMVSAKTGKAPFTFSLNQQAFQSDSVFTTIGAGTYQLRVVDANACMKTDSVTLENTPRISAQYKVIQVSCFNGNNGRISITPKTGKHPFRYSLNQQPSQSGSVFENLQAGSYTITITDSNQCLHTDSIIISQPQVLSYVKTKTAISCHNANDGSLSIIPGGGTAPYRIAFGALSYPLPTTLTHITHGVYPYRIIDSNGCFVEVSDTFENPQEINAGAISGDSIVTQKSTHTYSVPFQQNLNYVWSIMGGTLISSSPNPPTATVQWDSMGVGLIRLAAYDGICGDTTALEVHIGSTGLNELTQTLGVTVYPNPAHNILNISVKQLPDEPFIRIYDIQGRLLMQQELLHQQQLNIEALTPGVYQLKIGAWSGQVVKE